MSRLFAPQHPANASVAMQVRSDQLQLLFRQSFLATFGSVGGALALSWLQRDIGNHSVIAPWLITLGLAGVIRVALFWAYNRSTPEDRTPARWEGVYLATLILIAGIWGSVLFCSHLATTCCRRSLLSFLRLEWPAALFQPTRPTAP